MHVDQHASLHRDLKPNHDPDVDASSLILSAIWIDKGLRERLNMTCTNLQATYSNLTECSKIMMEVMTSHALNVRG